MPSAEDLLTAIRDLRVQGAERVAYAGALAFILLARDCLRKPHWKTCLLHAAERVRAVRPTEPHLQAYLHFLIADLPAEPKDAWHVLYKRFTRIQQHYRHLYDRLARVARQHLPSGKRIATHCHSMSALAVIRALNPVHVYASETRPRWQGRLTARDLIRAGIPVTLRVDSAMYLNVHDADSIIVGSDAILPEGVVNKIGTRMLALLAMIEEKPFYVVTDVFKRTKTVTLESRDPREVWQHPPSGVHVENPAFDVTPHVLITAFITPDGIFPPEEFLKHTHSP